MCNTERNLKIMMMGALIGIIGIVYSDLAFLAQYAKMHQGHVFFAPLLLHYLYQEPWFYLGLSSVFIALLLCHAWFFQSTDTRATARYIKMYYSMLVFLTPLLIVYPLPMMQLYLWHNTHTRLWIDPPLSVILIQHTVYSLMSGFIVLSLFYFRERYKIQLSWIKQFTHVVGIGAVITMIVQAGLMFASNYQTLWSEAHLKTMSMTGAPLVVLVLFTLAFRQFLKKKQFDVTTDTEPTSGHFGTARYANSKDLMKLEAYHPSTGPFIGMDRSQPLYLPLCNKLTISPPGGGKTTCSSIPVLLEHEGPVFVFDVKGELWAVTARYRAEILGRNVIVIDPFGVTRSDDFRKNKVELLQKEYTLNPFDWIPDDQKQRDRMMNAFAASFVINEGGHATHFDDNAKILIRGYIDYLMQQTDHPRHLPMLYQLMSENLEQAHLTFEQMAQCSGRAGAAAQQIHRVGSDERGSILSTSYRQIDWMGDSNIQAALSSSNFDLRDFLKGNMDIFVVLPADQVKEHNRLFRMILSLLMSLIVHANPRDLPKKKMLFLLEELAQLGASPDVEQCIEVMRTHGVVVWTVFQALKQIELFSKPDLFLSVPLKQIFTNDDIPTLQWVQNLAGKKTVLSKTHSSNMGSSRQTLQVFGGNTSSGEGESIQEIGVDLIPLNEIRELAADEQFIFLHGAKPIRCKKIRYFEHTAFLGKFDPNPLEVRHTD